MRNMHKIGKDWGISPLKNFINKESNKEIDKILHDVNNTLYFFNTLYLNSKSRTYLLNVIKNNGEKLNNVSVTVNSGQARKKKELLTKLREVYSNILKVPSYDDDYFSDLIEKMGNFKMALFIKEKNNNELTDEKIFKWMSENKLFFDIYGYNKNIDSIQTELLKKYLVNNNK